MRCDYFDAGLCRACSLMGVPYAQQLADKQRAAESTLAEHTGLAWLDPVASPESGYRNKAKMVVGGSVAKPTLGILDAAQRGIDLRGCGLHDARLTGVMPVLADFVGTARLEPYDVVARRGELKLLLATVSPDGELLLRFVLRSQESVARIRKHLPALRTALPQLRVVSANLLPEHRAAIEGETEILLGDEQVLPMRLGSLELHLRPQGFFQTNSHVAERLYAHAGEWIAELDPASVWDLYCGVGGFALSAAAPGRDVVGIELSGEAIAAAQSAARASGVDGVRFEAADATTWAPGTAGSGVGARAGAGAGVGAHGDAGTRASTALTLPETVIVNPPRRGIGPLADWLERTPEVRSVVYSSCNVDSLARDLRAMPSFTARAARVLDMFPQTPHSEVLVRLER
ncbi:methyltransferase domain-containing protein [Schumannella sp. 10F1B-5-1]|uniref:methyltransferase domain-containing protein n=1 Tax=Schumannella sp. 10F1B-5-1 TaxID=2590780 RepID=UPI0011306B67|nr:methyltransferase domain-containing protein [Schumannella sp. 10F1B-5-1]TPW71485.1 methyltransferase domain-containing protein [Schumannella sp. 10F1B-5-1]